MSNGPHLRPNGNIPAAPGVTVPPQPTPVQAVINQCEVSGQPHVMIQLATPTGLHVTFWPVADARSLAENIRRAATPIVLGS